MSIIEAIILGLTQGLTEFLPISSSAHLRIVGELIGSDDPGAAFTAITQIGTELAVLIYFRKDIMRIIKSWWNALTGKDGKSAGARLGSQNHDAKMGWFIILGSLPIIFLGLLFEDAIDGKFRNLYLTVAMLGIFAIILGVADYKAKQNRTLGSLSAKHAIIYGFAQAMALIPGVSRSGGTITAGLLMGYTREAAARYSFLLAMPAVFGSGFYKLFSSLSETDTGVGLFPTFIATVVAFAVGYVVIVWFLKLISHFSYAPFVGYRLVLCVVVLVLLGFGVLEATSGA